MFLKIAIFISTGHQCRFESLDFCLSLDYSWEIECSTWPGYFCPSLWNQTPRKKKIVCEPERCFNL